MPLQTFPTERLQLFCEQVFRHCGVPAEDARTAAGILAAADLRGIDSHGIARLPIYYELLAGGEMNPRPNPRIVRETPSTATFDGDNGLGLVIGPQANALAMEKAAACGSGWVGVCNSNHFGIAGYYSMQALGRDLIGIAMTNASKLVVPHGGAARMLGTNPLAIAFPGLEEPPIVIDMATSTVAYGKIQIANRTHRSIPDRWALDAAGAPTTDPAAMVDGGALVPLGSDVDGSGHKGFCLSTMVDVLCSVLTGANWGPFAPPFALRQHDPTEQVGKGIGHFFGALRIDGFIEPDAFKQQIDAWIRTFRTTPPAPGTDRVRIPGDPEREAEATRRQEGVPLVSPVVESLRALGRTTGIPFD